MDKKEPNRERNAPAQKDRQKGKGLPVAYMSRDERDRFDRLEDALIAEWQMPDTVAAPHLPILIEDPPPILRGMARKPLHLYIIWDEWADLS